MARLDWAKAQRDRERALRLARGPRVTFRKRPMATSRRAALYFQTRQEALRREFWAREGRDPYSS